MMGMMFLSLDDQKMECVCVLGVWPAQEEGRKGVGF